MAPKRSPYRLGPIALTILFVSILNQVQADDKCRTGCQRSGGGGGHSHGGAPLLKLQEGTTYKYNYDSKIEVTLSSAEGQKTTTEVKAQVLITPIKDCNQIIQLQNVQIIGSDGKKYHQIPDVDKPIRINYHDGHLEDSICTVTGDTQNSLNLKRAIASLLQINLHENNLHEIDIFGQCPTDIQQHKDGNNIIIHKTRDLNKCAYRENIRQDFLSTTFNLNSELKSSPLLNGDYSAKLRIKNGILEQVNVIENYLYMPLSVGNNGAKALIETKLQYLGNSKGGGKNDICTIPKSIIFEDPHPVNSPTSNVNSILAAVKQAAKTIDIVVNENTAKEFINLVKILRVSNKDDLLAVYNQVRAGVGFADKQTTKKLFLDAVLRAGNGDTLEVAFELLKNKELNEYEQNLVFLSLPLVRHTTESAISKISELLANPDYPRRLYLDIGHLIGKHCRQHNCKNLPVVQSVLQKFLQVIGDGHSQDNRKETEIIYALKGLKNTGFLTDTVINRLITIAQNRKLSNRLRVQALQTYQSDACNDQLRNTALSLLKDIQEDAEVRIHAYLILTKCPNAKIGNAIKQLLEQEPSYQVGGFIVSHIKQIRASTNIDKELQKQHLGYLHLPNRYPIDPRKYSYSGEFSYNFDTLGISNSIENNLIYSQDSYLPRSTSLNITAQLFGHTLNFLEIETRQQNLDRLFEHYFGRRGVLRDPKTLQELFKNKAGNLKEFIGDVKERFQKQLRFRRDLNKAEIEQITKQIDDKSRIDDVDLDFTVKMFGDDVLFVNINDDAKKLTPNAIIDQIIDGLNRGIDSIKNFEETLKMNLLFLDADLSYPTQTGFPLRLGIEGAANIQIKTSGSVDLRNLFKQDATALKLSLIPSVNVEIAGRLTLDALLVENGLKVISTLHSSTGGDLQLKLTNSDKIVDVKFSLPVEKQNLLTIKHNIVFHTRELGAPERNQLLKFTQNNDFSICLDQLNQIIGLTLCVDINGPNLQGQNVPILPYPLAGDAKFAIYIEKDDISLYHYHHVLYNRNEKFGGELQLESLNNQGQKKVSLQLEGYLIPERYFKVTLISPIKTAVLEGRVIINQQEKSALLRFTHDQVEYYGKIGVGITGTDSRAVYRPILEYKTPQENGVQQSPHRIDGQVIVEKQGQGHVKFVLDNVKIISPNVPQITVTGDLGEDGDGIFTNLQLTDGKNSGTLNGRLKLAEHQLKYNIEMKNTLNPQVNFHLKGDLSKTNEEIKQSLELIHGQDLSSKTNRLTIDNHWRYHNKGPEDYSLITKNNLKYPFLSVNLRFDLIFKPKQLDYNVNLQYSNVKIGSELETKWNHKNDGTDYDIEFELWGLGNRLETKAKRTVTGEQSKIDNSIGLNDKKIEVNGNIKHHLRPQDIDIGSDLIVKIPQHSAPIKVTNGLKCNPNEIDAFNKIVSGATVYVDIFIKANKVGNANGAIKINTDNLIVNGQLKQTKGKGNGDLTIQLPKIKQTYKMDTTYTIHEPNYDILINLYTDNDKTKKITISTQNKITATSLDTKNQLDLFGNQLNVNGKFDKNGDLMNGKINCELDIELPTKHYLLAKFNREVTEQNRVINGNAVLSLEFRENKNTPGKKISLTGQARNTNPRDGIYDLNYNLQAENGGKNFNGDLNFKRQKPSGTDTAQVNLNGKLSGTLLDETIEYKLISNYQDYRINSYELRTNYGQKNILTIKGNYNLVGNGQPLTNELNIDLQTTSQALRTVRLATTGSLHKTDKMNVKGTILIYADAHDGVIVDYNGNIDVQAGEKNGRLMGSLKYQQNQPITIDLGYKQDLDSDKKQLNLDGVLSYDKKTLKFDANLLGLSKNEYKFDGHLITDKDKFGLQSHSKISDSQEHQQYEVILSLNNDKWTINNDLYLTQYQPSIDLKIKTPKNKLIQLLWKITKLTQTQFGGELKMINQLNNFILESQIDANINNVDDFHIKGNLNCPPLKLDKIVFDIQNKQGVKAGRRIQINIKSLNKNLLQGSTSYQAREESGGKLIVEGSGSFKLKEQQQQSANFKYIKHNLNQQQHGENGVEISFDASLGNRAIDAELKLTNKQFRMLESYCEAKKECAYVEIDSKTNDDGVNFNQELEIGIDLRKLGLNNEFGLKAVTNRKNLELDHSIDIHFQTQDNHKYQYTHYIKPKTNGISLTTPQRIISLENNLNIPNNFYKNGGRLTIETLLFMDKKNHPNIKSSLITTINIQSEQLIEYELKLEHPKLQRPLLINGNYKQINNKQRNLELILDIFAQPQQKLVIKAHENLNELNENRFDANELVEIKSDGLQINIRLENNYQLDRQNKLIKSLRNLQYTVGRINYNSAFNFELTPQQTALLLRLNNIDLIKFNCHHLIERDLIKFDSELSTIGDRGQSILTNLEIKNYNTLKLSVAKKGAPQNKLLLTSALIPGQIADLRGELLKNSQKHDLFHATIKLDEANFLKMDYNIDSKNIDGLVLEPMKSDSKQRVDEIRKLLEKLLNERQHNFDELTTILKRSIPNLQPLRDYYINELKVIKDEIAADQTIRDLTEFIQNLIAALTDAFGDTFNKFSDFIENVIKAVHDSFKHILDAIDKDLLPKLKQFGERLINILTDIINRITDILMIYVVKLSEIAEKYQPELKQIATTLGEISQDLIRVVMKAYDNVRTVVLEQYQRFYNELKAQPIIEEIRAQYQQYIDQGIPPLEMLINSLRDIQSTIKDIIPLEEFRQLIDLVGNYIEKKLQQQPVDDLKELERILKATIQAVRKMIDIITKELATPDLQNIKVPTTSQPLSLLHKLPRLVAIKFSPFNYLLQEDIKQTSDLLLSLVNKPRNWLPPFPLYGLVAQGQHIFTFDGKHITFPGKCNYILAHDAIDNNFTIIGSYTNNGQLQSITLKQDNDLITLKKGGQILYNNQPIELPFDKDLNIGAYRNYDSLHLIGNSGVEVICGEQLIVCSITISGFYHNKLRGLLGNGNNEPYDDYKLINNKIVQQPNEFVNNYKTSSSCANVQTIEHPLDHQKSTQCNQLFGWESELRLCYPFVNTDNFKLACQHGLMQNVKDTEFAIAVAYVAACKQHGIPIRVPSKFVKCHNSDKIYDIGDKFSVKVPQKAADVVLAISVDKANESLYREFIQPLIQQLNNELHGKGINDVEFHLVTYGGDRPWVSHVTVGGKLTFKGKAPNLRFSEPQKQDAQLVTGCTYLDHFLDVVNDVKKQVKLLTGDIASAKAFGVAFRYPFRAHAIKTLIYVNDAECQISRFSPFALLHTLFYREKSVHFNMITPVSHLTRTETKHTKDIVGFNEDQVFTVGQTKSRPSKLSDELLKELDYNDWCIDTILTNNGNVFVANNILQAKGAAKKQFVQTTSHIIVDQLLNVEQHLDCECKYSTPFSANNVCDVVNTVEKHQPKKAPSKS